VRSTSRSLRSPVPAGIFGRMTVQDHDRVDEYPQETVDNINLLSQGGPP
jgi:hypothetical protein